MQQTRVQSVHACYCALTVQTHAPKYSDVVAVVDPPRAGLHKNVVKALLACDKIQRLVYVSCNPDSLADNLISMCGPARGSQSGKGKLHRPWYAGSVGSERYVRMVVV